MAKGKLKDIRRLISLLPDDLEIESLPQRLVIHVPKPDAFKVLSDMELSIEIKKASIELL